MSIAIPTTSQQGLGDPRMPAGSLDRSSNGFSRVRVLHKLRIADHKYPVDQDETHADGSLVGHQVGRPVAHGFRIEDDDVGFPHIAGCADEIAVVRSMRADLPLHSTGVLLLHTGSNAAGRPSLGSWTTYGLGSENQNLPGFVVLKHDVVPCGGMENYSSGFLPATHQATILRAEGTPLENLTPAAGVAQRALLAKRTKGSAYIIGTRLCL